MKVSFLFVKKANIEMSFTLKKKKEKNIYAE